MQRQLKVLHISAANPTTGAGGAALKLHTSLLKHGINSRLLFLKGFADESNRVYAFNNTGYKRILRLVVTTLDRLSIWFYFKKKKQIFSPGLFGLNLISHPMVQWADVIHLHWVNHGFINIGELKRINKPIVWTMHDMWVLTGGCHHSFNCDRFKTACGKCPMLGSSNEKDLSYWVLKNKLKYLPVKKINWVSISSWMAGLAKESILLKDEPTRIIYSGIDTNIFRPKDKDIARKELSLPLDKTIILLGADNLHSPYKGVQFSIEALKSVNKDYLVVTFGNGRLNESGLDQEVINLGYISDVEKLVSLYSASNLFLATSVAEAFGMTVAEAQCCGVNVVAFNSVGPKDIVQHKVTGYLAETKSISDLVEGINYCLLNNLDQVLIRKRAVDLFSIDSCTIKYIDLYKECFTE